MKGHNGSLIDLWVCYFCILLVWNKIKTQSLNKIKNTNINTSQPYIERFTLDTNGATLKARGASSECTHTIFMRLRGKRSISLAWLFCLLSILVHLVCCTIIFCYSFWGRLYRFVDVVWYCQRILRIVFLNKYKFHVINGGLFRLWPDDLVSF